MHVTAVGCAASDISDMQWTRDEPQEQAEALPSFTVEVGLCGIGISIVDASSLRLPREVRKILCLHGQCGPTLHQLPVRMGNTA